MRLVSEENKHPVRVGMISLGCAKNLVDAEIILGGLVRDGMEITNEAELADVVIVNTCSFIESAQEESVDAILESAQVRDVQNRRQGLIVAGCLPQRFRSELPDLFPEVDAFMGIDQVAHASQIVLKAAAHRAERLKSTTTRKGKKVIVERLVELDKAQPEKKDKIPMPATVKADDRIIDVNSRPTYIPDYGTPRFRLTPRHFAYVKIAEGCNHPCSFCIIPRMRGSHRSRQVADIVEEARGLIASGVKELNLISQDTTYYGLDLRPKRMGAISSPEKFKAATQSLSASAPTLALLLRELNALPGEFWIRLLYTHPAHWTDELIGTIAQCEKVVRYVDIPLQHIHPVMLEKMRRETTQQYIVDLLQKIRAGIPGVALRTTFIAGFPGETEAHFKTLLDFIEATRFERLGVFTYSHEEGTLGAKMTGQVADPVKKQRRDEAMAVQQRISRQLCEAQMGKTIRVLIEKEASAKEMRQELVSSWEYGLLRAPETAMSGIKGKFLVSRGQSDAPDIDGRVYVRGTATPGEFLDVKISAHGDYDLVAQPI